MNEPMRTLSLLPLVLALLAPVGCGSSGSEASTSDEDLSSFDANRNRTCTGGCAEGTVCDDTVHACVAEPAAPVLTFPISGAVTTGLPELRVTTAASASESAIEICKDAACTQSVALVSGAAGATLTASLPRGTYFARAWGLRKEADGHVVAGATATKPRVFKSNGRAVPSKTALAWFSDFDADGLGDRPVEGAIAKPRPNRPKKDEGVVLAGGLAVAGPLVVPDMDGNGRTELAEIRDGKLLLSRLGEDGEVAVSAYDVSAQAKLLLLGDVDRDGYFDLGAAQELADGVRLEIFHGAPAFALRRRTVDVRMPSENGKPTARQSVSAIGDVDGDGVPDLALGGWADVTMSQWGATTPRAGVFVDGIADADRLYVFRGAAAQPFSQVLARLDGEGSAGRGLVPLGDVDGDGVMDVLGLDTRVASLAEWEADTHMTNHWNKVGRGLRPGQAFVVFGGSALRKAKWRSPSVWREGPAASWANGPSIVGTYDEVQGIRTIDSGRAREEYFFDVSVIGGGDWDGDGFFDVAFGFSGARRPAPLSGEQWDAWSDPSVIRDYTIPSSYGGPPSTWNRFASFVEARYGSAQGLAITTGQRLLSATLEASPSMAPWVVFPTGLAARTNGLYVSEDRGATHMNPPYFTPFAATFAGPPGLLAPVP